MIGFLRRHQPRNRLLAALFWIAAVVLAVAILFVAFYYLGDFLPGADPPAVEQGIF